MGTHLLLALLYNATVIIVCGFAFLRGGRPEKIGAAANLVASLLTFGLRLSHITRGAPAELAVLAIDTGVLASFFWLAVRTVRYWPVWAFGFALADVFVSLAGGLIPNTPLFAYQTGLGIYAYLALAALALGTFRLPRHASQSIRNGFRADTVQVAAAAARYQ